MNAIIRFGQYCSVATLSAGSDWLVFIGMVSFLDCGHLPSLMGARLVGGGVSFALNRSWTWGANASMHLTVQGRRFLLLYSVSYTLSVAIFSILMKIGALSPYANKLITDVTCFTMNFIAMHIYVFSQRSGLIAAIASRLGQHRSSGD